jgi:hypothetical protein
MGRNIENIRATFPASLPGPDVHYGQLERSCFNDSTAAVANKDCGMLQEAQVDGPLKTSNYMQPWFSSVRLNNINQSATSCIRVRISEHGLAPNHFQRFQSLDHLFGG